MLYTILIRGYRYWLMCIYIFAKYFNLFFSTPNRIINELMNIFFIIRLRGACSLEPPLPSL